MVIQKFDSDTVNHSVEGVLKDSGDRREFESGAVRDMAEGKGRCDLLPLDVMYMLTDDDVFSYIDDYKNSGATTNLFSILYKCKDPMHWNTYADMLLDLSKHFEDGAKKYGDNNWQKGIPTNCYIDSAIRHYLKWLRGDIDEPHDRAFVWNIVCCIWTCEHMPELNVYAKEEKDE